LKIFRDKVFAKLKLQQSSSELI